MKRVVTEDGQPIRPEDLAVDGVVTVWPEGHTDAADAPTLLIKTRPTQELKLQGEKVGWVVGDIVAYSKLCTHVGCPVGLYQADEGLLLCPCHQSTFDVLDGARPIFGPAARPLPQLPLALDAEGYIVATGDFEAPVGPGFWDRGSLMATPKTVVRRDAARTTGCSPTASPAGPTSASARPASPAPRSTRSSRTTGRS